jgi:hypothetical protein
MEMIDPNEHEEASLTSHSMLLMVSLDQASDKPRPSDISF